MDELSKEYVISFFERKLMMHGDRADAVGWSEKGQLLRYQEMLHVGDIHNSKVLDFGCGKGDFYRFLNEREIPVTYTGFDINEKLIDLAKKKFPNIDFRVFDMDKDVLDEDFDHIFLCGVFNLKVQGIDGLIKKVLTTLFNHCRKTLAFNALSSLEPAKDFQLNYIAHEDIIEFAVKNLSPNVVLRQGRIPYDFTLFVYNKY
ncbi:MAG: class I SAM-dependent methyltransferase [Nitrospirota bacterium]